MSALMASRASCSRATVAARPRQVSSRVTFNKVQRFNRFAVRAENAPAASTSAAPSAAVAEVNDDNFKAEVLNHTGTPVMVDFWAPWCGPCRFIAPLIDEIAKDYGSALKVVKLDTDKSPKTATALGIRSIPTVLIFKDGVKMEAVIGAVPKETLVKTLERFM